MDNILKKSIVKYRKMQDLMYRVQKLSNEIRIKSKQIIALMRRRNIKESKVLIENVNNQFKLINELTKRNEDLLNQSFYKQAVEEYIEAITFYNFLSGSKRELPGFVKIEPEEIISGICDFTGELARRAVTISRVENFEKLLGYKKVIETIVEDLTKIAFRGKLWQKYDEAERNLRRIEDIIYDIKLKK